MEVDVQLVSVVGPRAELECADLDVEREVQDVDRARRPEDGRRKPQNVAIVADHRHRVPVFLQPSVGAIYIHREPKKTVSLFKIIFGFC